ncbi:hypothetical protein DFR72_11791 [Lentzea flaviverrucosa]|uniref:NAD+-dependent secondary alcohol dehydrogenase Adh1 n=1 Tax=Lentzea flaviverrucosa TaxID=200379 RepID=A0A1H9XU35_9PSEU|nr:hypothetical protein DFR72_11791 [Lentzea flaviverrucosa]SES49267.1 NAD+-dependent secondary alcohol dehydrogenase Adh1 [Lentzea flaviverrucosa]
MPSSADACAIVAPGACELMVLAAQGKVTLHTQKYPLDRLQDAIDDLDGGRVRGRAILTP